MILSGYGLLPCFKLMLSFLSLKNHVFHNYFRPFLKTNDFVISDEGRSHHSKTSVKLSGRMFPVAIFKLSV